MQTHDIHRTNHADMHENTRDMAICIVHHTHTYINIHAHDASHAVVRYDKYVTRCVHACFMCAPCTSDMYVKHPIHEHTTA